MREDGGAHSTPQGTKAPAEGRPFGWLFVGAGDIAHTVATQLARGRTGMPVAVWNRSPRRAEEFAHRFGATPYTRLEDALADSRVEAAYVATVASAHAPLASTCIEAGIPVLVEKPFAANAREATEVFDLATSRGVYASEAMWTWHSALARQVRALVRAGTLGTIREVRGTYAFPIMQMTRKERLTSPALCGGALTDIGIYLVRYCLELFGRPVGVRAEGRLSHGVDLGERVTLSYPGFEARLDVAMDRLGGERLAIAGSKGTLRIPSFHEARRAALDLRPSGGAHTILRSGERLLYDVELSHVAEDVRAGRLQSREVPRFSTLAQMDVLDECRRQLGVAYPQDA